MNMVTQSGSGSWLFSSSWEQGMRLWLFRGSGLQGGGTRAGQHGGLKGVFHPPVAPSRGWWAGAADMVPLVVFGAGKGFQWNRHLVQDSLSWSSLLDGTWTSPDVESCDISQRVVWDLL